MQVRKVITLWDSLSTGSKDAWKTLALNTPFKNIDHETYFLSAYRMFTKVNGILINFGESYLLSNPPASYAAPAAQTGYTLSLSDEDYSDNRVKVLSFDETINIGVCVMTVAGTKSGKIKTNFDANIAVAAINDKDTIEA